MPPLEVGAASWATTVQVHPSALRPHHSEAEGPERGTYVRLGSTNRKREGFIRRRPGAARSIRLLIPLRSYQCYVHLNLSNPLCRGTSSTSAIRADD
jgi:hypothetical protein